jgi:transcription initiation factor TFIID subunit 4
MFFFNYRTVLIKSNSGQLMLVSPQQAVTRADTTNNKASSSSTYSNSQNLYNAGKRP